MRPTKGLIKRSGDVHPPELDDGFDEADEPLETASAPPRQRAATAAIAPAAKPSLMPLLALLGGVFLLYRLVR